MEEEVKEKVEGSSLDQLAGKYLTFALGEEDYGIEILTVREIIGVMEITQIPQVPTYLRGIINLRGKVIPVVDLRAKFQMPVIEDTEETCIVVVSVQEVYIGVLIDRVNEVLDVKRENIEPPPKFGSTISSDYILGIGKINDSIKILLGIEKVLIDDISRAQDISN
ncbi:Positive regulator of CheA protein activity (CheW) [hydrothermal vent metagenome]|uniref:Positive regulator of CheA protein activity (CheW) n=1 Tax=hydrothermal vent metagenome TaxID=652676 RepID=A0A3B0T8A1_9ZZZZ